MSSRKVKGTRKKKKPRLTDLRNHQEAAASAQKQPQIDARNRRHQQRMMDGMPLALLATDARSNHSFTSPPPPSEPSKSTSSNTRSNRRSENDQIGQNG